MAGLLGGIYSAADSLKRRFKGLLADPVGEAQQALGMLADDAKVANERNKRMIHNPEQITEQDMRDSFNSVMNFAPIGMLAKAPRAEAMRIAQQNAAKPISEGGLGLRPDNTPMERAKAMGAIDAYHGSPNEIVGTTFDRSKAGVKPTNTFDSADAELFASSSPSVANEYAVIGRQSRNPYDEFYGMPVAERNKLLPLFNDIAGREASRDDVYEILKRITQDNDLSGTLGVLAEKLGVKQNVSPNVMPLKLSGKGYEVDWGGKPWVETEMQRKIREARASGADYLVNKNIVDTMTGQGLADSYAVLNPSSVRSRFAAFDPARRHEADLLGQVNPELLPWLIGGGLLGGYGVKQAQE